MRCDSSSRLFADACCCSVKRGKSSKVVSHVYQAAAAIIGTEAHSWKKARGKTAIRRAVNACGQRGIPHLYSLDALMPVTRCIVSNMSKQAFDACCKGGKSWHIHRT